MKKYFHSSVVCSVENLSLRELVRETKVSKKRREAETQLNLFLELKRNLVRLAFQESNPKKLRYMEEILSSPVITPKRYIYHVSPRCNRESIMSLGLLPGGEKGAVFANNLEINCPWSFYPFCMDPLWTMPVFDFDFWLIDTAKISALWHEDPFLLDDQYVCTLQNIPVSALRLLTLNPLSVSTGYMDLDILSFEVKEMEKVNRKIRYMRVRLPVRQAA